MTNSEIIRARAHAMRCAEWQLRIENEALRLANQRLLRQVAERAPTPEGRHARKSRHGGPPHPPV